MARAASLLSSPSPREKLFDVENPAAFELNLPDYRILVLVANGSQLEFSIGRETLTGSSRYVISPDIEGILITVSLELDEILGLFSTLNTPSAPLFASEAGSYRVLVT